MKQTRFGVLALGLLALSVQGFAFGSLNNTAGSHYDMVMKALADWAAPPYGVCTGDAKSFLVGWAEYSYDRILGANWLGEAARDTDQYFFGEIAAHSQPPSYDTARRYSPAELRELEAAGLFNYFLYTQRLWKQIRGHYRQGDARAGNYLFGFYLHTFEDLFSHRGITNEQHLWLGDHGHNPDYDNAHIARCTAALQSYFRNLPAVLGKDAAAGLGTFLASTVPVALPSEQEASSLLGHSKDILLEGIKYKVLTSYTDECMRYAAVLSWDIDTIERMLNDPVAMDRIDRLATRADLDALLADYSYDWTANSVMPEVLAQAAAKLPK